MIKKIWIPLIIILVIAGLFLIGRFWIKLGSKQYDSYEKFKKYAYLRFTVDIPAGASDQKFFTNNLGIGGYSLYAFTLDKEEYDKFIDYMVEEYDLESNPDDEKVRRDDAQFYLKKFSEVLQDNDSYEESFPTKLKYKKVIDDDINTYDVILFYPQYSGSYSYGLFANPATGRIVVMNKYSIR